MNHRHIVNLMFLTAAIAPAACGGEEQPLADTHQALMIGDCAYTCWNVSTDPSIGQADPGRWQCNSSPDYCTSGAAPGSGGPGGGGPGGGGSLGGARPRIVAGMTWLLSSVTNVIPCGPGLVGLLALGQAESGLDPNATLVNGPTAGCPNGSRDRGIWQINDCHHPEVSDACAYDPVCSAVETWRISSNGTNWSQWVAYNNGSVDAFTASAQAAVQNICK